MKISRWLAIGLLACAMVLVEDHSATSAERSPTPVRVQAVESYVASGGARYSASINPYTQVDLAFKVGGYIQEILQVQGADDRMRDVQGGDWVKKGTILARVRQRDYVEKVNQAKAQLATAQASGEQAKAQLAKSKAASEKAKLDFERATNLLATQSMTKADYDAAKANLEVAQAGVNEAQGQIEAARARVAGMKAQLAEAEIALGDSALKVPVDGILLRAISTSGPLWGLGR